MKSMAVVVGIVIGSIVGAASTIRFDNQPVARRANSKAPQIVQPNPVAAVGESLVAQSLAGQPFTDQPRSGQSLQSAQVTARQVGPNGPTWAEIPMDQFSKMTDPMPSIILPPPSNPGPRTRAPWWNYHYVTHTDGKTWHVEPTLDINGNPIPIYWPE